ncbi:hypothetical protein [Natrinema versiforme]|uniref:Uncharacterized protein n=1 Tax=Natrinema versiforme TaxID=88724 RepID=A0A4P8WIY5_9EURY|nr:hypothetical protein [Natrinema versiforme]QCS43042.1 hypothetical protein FEJ81_12000 [Natrinema versiforme]
MSPASLRDQLRSPAAVVIGLLWLASSIYGILSSGSILVFSILPIGLIVSVILLQLFYRLVVAVEHLAYDS